MTNEEKELLLKDLCARLPYGVKLDFYSAATDEHIVCTLLGIEPEGDKPVIAKVDCGAFMFPQEHIKPYLRPISSMTEKENEELKYVIELELQALESEEGHNTVSAATAAFEVDFYNKHHFDYRGLIPMGLALEAPEDMYKTE